MNENNNKYLLRISMFVVLVLVWAWIPARAAEIQSGAVIDAAAGPDTWIMLGTSTILLGMRQWILYTQQKK